MPAPEGLGVRFSRLCPAPWGESANDWLSLNGISGTPHTASNFRHSLLSKIMIMVIILNFRGVVGRKSGTYETGRIEQSNNHVAVERGQKSDFLTFQRRFSLPLSGLGAKTQTLSLSFHEKTYSYIFGC